jgi:hypothetical protein
VPSPSFRIQMRGFPLQRPKRCPKKCRLLPINGCPFHLHLFSFFLLAQFCAFYFRTQSSQLTRHPFSPTKKRIKAPRPVPSPFYFYSRLFIVGGGDGGGAFVVLYLVVCRFRPRAFSRPFPPFSPFLRPWLPPKPVPCQCPFPIAMPRRPHKSRVPASHGFSRRNGIGTLQRTTTTTAALTHQKTSLRLPSSSRPSPFHSLAPSFFLL